jgi:hypothetical protein
MDLPSKSTAMRLITRIRAASTELKTILAYSLLVTLKNRLQALAPGLTPRAVFEILTPMQMPDVTADV